MTIRVGLTGGVASGKSTVSAMLRELGAVVIDADQIARDVVAAGTPGLDQVVAAFGRDVLDESGELDRPAMGRRVFGDETARRRLESIVHPLVFEEIGRQEEHAAGAEVVVHDIPLLTEGGPERIRDFDAIVVVDADEEVQVERMVSNRGWEETEARSRIAAQATREDRLAIASYVVDNTGTRQDLRDQVAEVYASILERG